MTRHREIVEWVSCDVCGRRVDDAVTVVLGRDGEQWELDLCANDQRKLASQFERWVEKGRVAHQARSPRRRTDHDEWAYLESLGFKRHRGRKSTAEIEALARRQSGKAPDSVR
jgi:hypothetical protein